MQRFLGFLDRGRARVAPSLWGIGEYFSYPLLMFLATPFFLHWLGAVQYGQWMLVMTLVGLGGIAGLGMGAAATKDVSRARGRGDPNAAIAAVRACLTVTLLSSGILCLIFLALDLLVGTDFLSRMGDPYVVRAILSIGAFIIVIEQLDSVFAGAMRGMERFDLSARIEIAMKTMLVSGALFAAWYTKSLWVVLATTVSFSLLRLAFKFLATSRLMDRILWPSWRPVEMRLVFAFGKWTWLQSLGAVLFATADRFLIGAMLGPVALAHYSVCLQLAQQVHAVPTAGAQFLFPAVSRRIAAGEDYRSLAIRSSVAVGFFGAALAVGLILCSKPLLQLWVGTEIAAASSHILILLSVAFALLAMNVGPYFVLLGTGHAHFAAKLSILSGVVSVVAAVLLIERSGIEGAAFSRGIYALIALAIIFPMVLQISRSPKPRLLDEVKM